MSWTWYGMSRATRASSRASRWARIEIRRGEKRSAISPARVRLRHVEEVEVRVELDTHRPECRDRLVEDDEPRGQPQVEAVDERERLRITSIGSMSDSRAP